MKAADYCANCNAPRKNAMAILLRCGRCLVVNGKLPPTKYQPLKGKK